MDSSGYRQSSEGKRAQLEKLRAHVGARIDASTALERVLRTAAERDEPSALQRRIEAHPTESLEQLGALESLLSELKRLADQLASVGRARTCIPHLPMFGEQDCGSVLSHEEPGRAALAAMLEEMSIARSVRLGDASYGTRHEAGGVPLNLRAAGHAGAVHGSVAVVVPTGLPQVRLAPERWLRRVGRLFGMSHEATVDDAAFHVEWPDELACVV